MLIDALISLDDPQIGCWIVGGGKFTKEFEATLQKTVRDSKSKTTIRFFGFQSDPRPFYLAADWHIAPSIYEEPLGNVVQEAKSCNTPSIVSPNGGLPELIANNVNGLILTEVSLKEISITIRTIADHRDNYQDYGDKAFDSLDGHLDDNTFNEKWQAVLKILHDSLAQFSACSIILRHRKT